MAYLDASDYAVGGILAQAKTKGEEKKLRGEKYVMDYYSKKLGTSERDYSDPEKEVHAFVHSLEAFRPFVFGDKVL